MSYYPAPGAPYVPQQPVNPYGGMGTVGLVTPLPRTQMPQTARHISTGIALLISKTKEGICPKLDRPPLYLLSALKIQL